MTEPYKVVIVDDEMISRGYMELFIKPSRRYEIAASLPFAADALTWCRENEPPDLIILDVMMASGVDGLTAAARIKREVMDRTMAGESVYPGAAPGVALGSLPASDLTHQQRNILRLLVEGLSNREIGERLFLSSNTVKDYLDDLMEKSGIHSRTALVAQASRLGIVVSDVDRMKDNSMK